MAYVSFTNGSGLSATSLNNAFGTGGWTAFTPSLAAGTLTIGTNGSLQGFYMQIGKTVFYRIQWTFGTGTIAQSDPQFAFPVAMSANVDIYRVLGTAIARDVSANQSFGGWVQYVTGMRFYLNQGTSALALLSSSLPFTIASGDKFSIMGEYPAA